MDSTHALPTGVVTFLLTDIEGSTRLWEQQPEAMRQALVRHDAILSTCVRRTNGHLVKSKGEGDSAFVVFRHVRDAVTAALVVQCALAAEHWGTSTPIHVRMAIHTGQIELRDGDYYGPTVNRCARLRALARGGQVLLSGVTAQLAQTQLPSGASLHDLGSQQLKDLSAPERVWQLVHPRMPSFAAPPEDGPAAAPHAPSRRAYMLTDHLNRTNDGREWGAGVRHQATGIVDDDEDARLRCYATPIVAALLNPLYEQFRLPRLWEATVDRELTPGEGVVECQQVTTSRQVALPTLTGLQHARFAVLCAQAGYEGHHRAEFSQWADGWLAGQDTSGINARALAESLERDASRAHPEDQMAGNAARAAMHASKVSWLAGRARDQENTLAMQYAAEAVHTALRLTQLDLVGLAEQAEHKTSSGPVLATRQGSPSASAVILKALPT